MPSDAIGGYQKRKVPQPVRGVALPIVQPNFVNDEWLTKIDLPPRIQFPFGMKAVTARFAQGAVVATLRVVLEGRPMRPAADRTLGGRFIESEVGQDVM